LLDPVNPRTSQSNGSMNVSVGYWMKSLWCRDFFGVLSATKDIQDLGFQKG